VLLTLSPWFVRNYYTFGQVFYTTRTEAIRYKLTGNGYLSPRYEHLAENGASTADEQPLDENTRREYERFGRQSQWFSLNFLMAHPDTYFRHLANRFIEYWFHPNGLQSLPENTVIRGLYIVVHLTILGLAIVGMVSGLSLRESASGVLVLLMIYITVTSLFLTGPNPRYNLPFLPIIFTFTARGTWALIERFAPRKLLPTPPGK
jgi:hypothetical protein